MDLVLSHLQHLLNTHTIFGLPDPVSHTFDHANVTLNILSDSQQELKVPDNLMRRN